MTTSLTDSLDSLVAATDDAGCGRVYVHAGQRSVVLPWEVRADVLAVVTVPTVRLTSLDRYRAEATAGDTTISVRLVAPMRHVAHTVAALAYRWDADLRRGGTIPGLPLTAPEGLRGVLGRVVREQPRTPGLALPIGVAAFMAAVSSALYRDVGAYLAGTAFASDPPAHDLAVEILAALVEDRAGFAGQRVGTESASRLVRVLLDDASLLDTAQALAAGRP